MSSQPRFSASSYAKWDAVVLVLFVAAALRRGASDRIRTNPDVAGGANVGPSGLQRGRF